MSNQRILLIGYGNPSRGDDGLGPALAEKIDAQRSPGVTVEIDYQLSVEHAALVAEHDVVVFADAAADAEAPFYFRRVPAVAGEAGLSHGMTPAQVMFLARSCFGSTSDGYLLGMCATDLRGFRETLSTGATAALDAALTFLRSLLDLDPREWPERETRDARRQAPHPVHR
jgi:hydrogenase maturation protease